MIQYSHTAYSTLKKLIAKVLYHYNFIELFSSSFCILLLKSHSVLCRYLSPHDVYFKTDILNLKLELILLLHSPIISHYLPVLVLDFIAGESKPVTWLIYVHFSGQVIHCATMATPTSLSSDCIDPCSGSHGYSLLSFSCDAFSGTEEQLLQANVF